MVYPLSLSFLGDAGFSPPQTLTPIRMQKNDLLQRMSGEQKTLEVSFQERSISLSLRPETVAQISELIKQIGKEYAAIETCQIIASLADVLLQSPFGMEYSYIPRKYVTPLPDAVKIIVDANKQLLFLLPKRQEGGLQGVTKHGRRLHVIALAKQKIGLCFALTPKKDKEKYAVRFLQERNYEDKFHATVQAYQSTRIADYNIETSTVGSVPKRLAFFEAYDCDLGTFLLSNINKKFEDAHFTHLLMLKIARALQVVHNKNFVLFDVKQRNILVRGENAEEIAFCDLEGVVDQNLPRSDEVIRYQCSTFRPPEHLLRILKIFAAENPQFQPQIDRYKDKPCIDFVHDDLRTIDIYALGVVFFSFLKKGQRAGPSLKEMLERYIRIVDFVPDEKPELHLPLDQKELVRHLSYIGSLMMHAEASQRPNIDEVVSYLTKLQEGLPQAKPE